MSHFEIKNQFCTSYQIPYFTPFGQKWQFASWWPLRSFSSNMLEQEMKSKFMQKKLSPRIETPKSI